MPCNTSPRVRCHKRFAKQNLGAGRIHFARACQVALGAECRFAVWRPKRSRRVTADYREKSKIDRLGRPGVMTGMARKTIKQISGGLARSQALPCLPEQSCCSNCCDNEGIRPGGTFHYRNILRVSFGLHWLGVWELLFGPERRFRTVGGGSRFFQVASYLSSTKSIFPVA